ncbi:hypothetical protein [Halorubellus salinus]|uniref:hypothetical protein n=1 Tax=Halorubellus salinus TaxID=755309 RepID=UPI001D06CE3C|nr:hypothetical protein [Halorubellus salinus]
MSVAETSDRGIGRVYRLFAVGFVLGGIGLALLGLTAGTGDPGVLARAGLVSLGAGSATVGGSLVRYRRPVAATDSKYDYGETTIAFFGVVFVAAGVVTAVAAAVV